MDLDEKFLVVGTTVGLPNEENLKDGRVLVYCISISGCIMIDGHQPHELEYSPNEWFVVFMTRWGCLLKQRRNNTGHMMMIKTLMMSYCR